MSFLNRFIGIIIFCIVFASPVNADIIHSLGDTDPDGQGFNTNNFFSGNVRGWSFTTGTNALSVSELGIAPVTSGFYSLGLWDFDTQTLLASILNVSVTGGDWNWFGLDSNVLLDIGSRYLVAGVGEGSNDTYYWGSGLSSVWYPTGDINYNEMHFCNNCAISDFPTSVLNGYQYGVVDIGYELSGDAQVSESSTMALLGLGLLSFGAYRRKVFL